MPPKRSSKSSGGLSQPTLSFQTRLKTTNSGKIAGKQAAQVAAAVPPPAVVEKEVVDTEVVDLDSVKVDERAELRPNSKEWNDLHKQAKAAMGGIPPIHGEGTTKVQDILRVFDMTSKYGPAAGITRLERWERAKKWGLDPPEEIKSILVTKQGEDDAQYRESVLYGWV